MMVKYKGCSNNMRTDAAIASVLDGRAQNLHIMTVNPVMSIRCKNMDGPLFKLREPTKYVKWPN